MTNAMKTIISGKLTTYVYRTRTEMGKAAGTAAGEKLKELLAVKDEVNVIFAAAPSQNEMLEALTSFPGIDWTRVNGFHMDEYIGLPKDAPQGFGNFLRERIFKKLPFKNVYYLDGNTADLSAECARYGKLLEEHPVDMVCMGIGENGHIAFNDPWVADFNDPVKVKVVPLDPVCRQQQVNDGCFGSLDEVPQKALSLTIPALTAAPTVICTVPAATKARAVLHAVRGPVTPDCPASILQTHPSARMFCDAQSGRDVLFRKGVISDEISQDFEEAAKLAAEYGCEALEIRGVWGKQPQELDDGDIEKINEIAAKYRLSICAISSPIFKCSIDDREELEQHYEIAKKCMDLACKTGAKYLRAFSFWRKNGVEADGSFIIAQIGKLAAMAREKGLTVLVEHDPSVSACNAGELRYLFEQMNFQNVKILWDPGNHIYNKTYLPPYPDGYEQVKRYTAHIHLKDAVRDENGEVQGCLLGDGLLPLKEQLGALLEDGYDGFLVLETHFRLQTKLSDEELKRPGGVQFSDGGYEASKLCLERLNEAIEEVAANA